MNEDDGAIERCSEDGQFRAWQLAGMDGGGVCVCWGQGAEMETSKVSWRFLDGMPRQVTLSSVGAGRGGLCFKGEKRLWPQTF